MTPAQTPDIIALNPVTPRFYIRDLSIIYHYNDAWYGRYKGTWSRFSSSPHCPYLGPLVPTVASYSTLRGYPRGIPEAPV